MISNHISNINDSILFEGKPLPGQMGSIVAAIQPAIDRDRLNDSEEFYLETIKRNVMFQVQRLKTEYFRKVTSAKP